MTDHYEEILDALEDVASFATLMHLAAELGQARLSGDDYVEELRETFGVRIVG